MLRDLRCKMAWLFLMFWQIFVSSCKNPFEQELSKENQCKERESLGYKWNGSLCLPPVVEKTLDSSECLKVPGAKWDSETLVCDRSSAIRDCLSSGSQKLVWNGEACIQEGAEKNFYRYCKEKKEEKIAILIFAVAAHFKMDPEKIDCQNLYGQVSITKKLSLQSLGLVDLRPLRNLKNLVELDLWNNRIEDLNALSGLENLQVLKLGHNQISNIQPLGTLIGLRHLSLLENKITSIDILTKLEDLEFVDVSRNRIGNLDQFDKARFKKGFLMEGNEQPAPAFFDVKIDSVLDQLKPGE